MPYLYILKILKYKKNRDEGLHILLTFPINGTRWCSHRENMSMSFTITSSSWFSSKTASFKISIPQEMNTISLFAIQTGQDAWTLIKFFEVTENAKTNWKRKWPISSHLDCASLVNKEFSIVKPCKLRNGILQTC